jgi:cystathionine beta-lyase/cystathionine gamma-synthase
MYGADIVMHSLTKYMNGEQIFLTYIYLLTEIKWHKF